MEHNASDDAWSRARRCDVGGSDLPVNRPPQLRRLLERQRTALSLGAEKARNGR